MGTHGHDQRRALLVGEEHRHVLTGGRRRDHQVLEAQLEQALAAGSAPVGIRVDDQLGAGMERPVRGRIHVAEHHIRLEAFLPDGVGAAVHADQHRADVVDVGAQGPQVLAVCRPADDDQHVAVAELSPGRRQGQVADQELALLADVGDRVLRELRKRLVDPGPLLVEALLEDVERQLRPRGDHGSVHADLPTAQLNHVAVAELLEERRRRHLDEAHARAGEQHRPGIGIAAGRKRRDVHHRGDPAGHEVLGRQPVEVRVIDHGDLPRAAAA